MATRSDIPDLYICQVCLEDQTTRNPRLLSCHHSFCEECIQKLVKEGKVECPTCLQVTLVDDEEPVKTLSMNFMLLQMKEQMLKMREEMARMVCDQVQNCHECKRSAVCNSCKKCEDLFCGRCLEEHKNCVEGKGANSKGGISDEDTDSGNDGFKYICLKCLQGIHSLNSSDDHSNHRDQIIPYDKGIRTLKKNLEQLKEDGDKELVDVINSRKKKSAQISHFDEKMKHVELMYRSSSAKSEQLFQKLEIMKQQKEEMKNIIASYENEKDKIYNLGKSIDNALANKDRYILDVYPSLKVQADEELTICHPQSTIPDISLPYQEQHVQTTETRDSTTGDDWLTLVYETKHLAVFGITEPTRIQCIEPQIALITDVKSAVMVTVDINGRLLRKYNLPPNGVNDVIFYDVHQILWRADRNSQYFYLSHNREITKRTYPGFKFTASFKPPLKHISQLLVIREDFFLIYDKKLREIFEYDCERNELISTISDTNVDSMSLFFGPFHLWSGYVFIDKSSSEISIWNCSNDYSIFVESSWIHRPQIPFDHPNSCASIPKGLLVANTGANAICLIPFDESSTESTVLTEQDGIKSPISLDYKDEYIWMAEFDGRSWHSAVKCYKMK